MFKEKSLVFVCLISVAIGCRSSAQSTRQETPPAIAAPTEAKPTLDDELIRAIETGDESRVRALLAQGANPNAVKGNKSAENAASALGLAVANKNAAIVSALLNGGADIGGAGVGRRKYVHPLQTAVENGDAATIKVLEDYDAARNVISYSGALMNLARDEATVEYLIKSGRSVNETDADGNTPLMLAAARGDAKLVKTLLAKKANRHLKNRAGKTAFETAAERGDETVAALLKSTVSNSQSKELIERLTGTWKNEAAEDDYCRSLKIQFDDVDDDFCVQSNQIYISVYYKLDPGAKTVNIFFKEPTDLGRGGMGLEWDDFDRTKPIAAIDISNVEKNNRIALKWLGFTNAKTKRRVSQYGSDYQGIYVKNEK